MSNIDNSIHRNANGDGSYVHYNSDARKEQVVNSPWPAAEAGVSIPPSAPSPHPHVYQASTSSSSGSSSHMKERGGETLREKELQAEVTALTGSLDVLQKTLLNVQANLCKLRSDSKALHDDCESSSDQQTKAFQQAIRELQMHNDDQMVKANKIFVAKLEKYRLRFEEANKQVASLLASIDAVNTSAHNVRIERDKANLELTRSKIEILSLQKKLEEKSVQCKNLEEKYTLRKQQECTIYNDSNSNQNGGAESAIIIPTPPSEMQTPRQPSHQSKPSSARPMASRGHVVTTSSFANGSSFPVPANLPEWRRRILESYGIDDNGSAFETFGATGSDGKGRGKKSSPYTVNTLHEIPIRPTLKPENIAVPREILNDMAPAQRIRWRRPASTSAGVRKNARTGFASKDKHKREDDTGAASTTGTKNTTATKSNKFSSSDLQSATSKKFTSLKEMEQRVMKYEDDLSLLSSANVSLVNAMKSVYTLLNNTFKENEQLSDEINSLNARLVAMEYEGTETAGSILKSSLKIDLIEDRALNFMNDTLCGNEEFITGLMESNQHLSHMVSCLTDFAEDGNNDSGGNQDSNDGNDSPFENKHSAHSKYKLIADLTSSIRDLETILIDTKSRSHRNQLHLLSVKKEKEENQVQLMLMENELKQMRKEKDSCKSRDKLELKSRRITHETMIKDHKEAITTLHRMLVDLERGVSGENLVDADKHMHDGESMFSSECEGHITNNSCNDNDNNIGSAEVKEAFAGTNVENSDITRNENVNGDPWAGPSRRAITDNSNRRDNNSSVDKNLKKDENDPSSPWSSRSRRSIMSQSLTSQISKELNSDKGVYLPLPKRSTEKSEYVTPGALDTSNVVPENYEGREYIEPILENEELQKLIHGVVRGNIDIDDDLHEQVGKLELPMGWIEKKSDTGALYYWDEKRQQSAWMNPNMSRLIEVVDLKQQQKQKTTEMIATCS